MWTLSGFADEIDPDLKTQCATLNDLGITHIEFRSAWDTNVLDLTDEQLEEAAAILAAHDLAASSIGSPLGKINIEDDFDAHLVRADRALTVAQRLGAPFIRIFSFFLRPDPETGSRAPEQHRDEVLRRMAALAEKAAPTGIVLLHENEKDIYGDTIARCVDLLGGVDDPHFRALLDPANFLQCGQEPYPAGYEALRPWLAYVHVKDVDAAGALVVAGAGAADWPGLLARLRADGYDGFLSLEPHLAAAGQFAGFSGAARFREAAAALQRLLRAMDWAYA
jgi:3-dehydroshikimate dehydratase